MPTPKELQELRKKVGLTQAQLAKLVGISQSLVARIEKGKVNPSIMTLKRILNEIEKKQKTRSNIRDLIKWKRATTKLQPLIWISPNDRVRRAVILMKRHGISQLPVIKGNKSVGSISEGTIIRELMAMDSHNVFTLTVQEIMDPPFTEVEITESVESVFSKMVSGVDALIVVENGRPIGVITKIDVIAFTKI